MPQTCHLGMENKAIWMDDFGDGFVFCGPTCPIHHLPMWKEYASTPDHCWLTCPYDETRRFFWSGSGGFFCSGQSKPCVNFHFRPHNFPTNPRFFSSLNHQSSSVFILPFHRLITTFPAKVAILWYQHLTQTHIMLVICFVYPQYISLCHIETAVNYHFSPANPTV